MQMNKRFLKYVPKYRHSASLRLSQSPKRVLKRIISFLASQRTISFLFLPLVIGDSYRSISWPLKCFKSFLRRGLRCFCWSTKWWVFVCILIFLISFFYLIRRHNHRIVFDMKIQSMSIPHYHFKIITKFINKILGFLEKVISDSLSI
jgi:hypothetical protein